nr:MAG TPA: hypothetical protein [Bacteriophage sp.]
MLFSCQKTHGVCFSCVYRAFASYRQVKSKSFSKHTLTVCFFYA